LDLLQDKALSSFFCGSDVYKRVVTIASNPAAKNRVAILENLNEKKLLTPTGRPSSRRVALSMSISLLVLMF
jgi:hypothetical protein